RVGNRGCGCVFEKALFEVRAHFNRGGNLVLAGAVLVPVEQLENVAENSCRVSPIYLFDDEQVVLIRILNSLNIGLQKGAGDEIVGYIMRCFTCGATVPRRL